ncbi:SDR family NAD(P)-dependent oxidoreductase [Verrucomicrobium sp. BvORR106]|uniref:SDR family NAD(P)-dependent oxidoreductase n=1 Tax=Verrucomicrobium sp. BvORR106 TaxID=1403819 RepID=UPI00056EDD30|nr:SDR family NAD(P)-dependent oxidoreductase [Verrucomicrobium sp. BvORR106]
MNQYDLSGQTAIVTGSARGIGFAIAKRLLESGANVCLWDMDGDALEQAKEALNQPEKVHSTTVDVTSETSVAAATKDTLQRFGALSILVNNAGIAGTNARTWEMDPADWRRVVDIDLTGVFLCCRAVVPSLLANGYGRIVNIASVAGKEGNPNASHYSAAKAGVIALTKSLGKELATENICVNCITPAVIETDILKQLTPQHVDYMRSKIPMNRFGKVEEAAAMATWLCSADCSFSTAATFDLTGGRATY